MNSLAIRHAAPEDATSLARLLSQLGYPTEAAAIPERLTRLRSRPGTAVLVAELAGRAVGVVTVHLFDTMHTNEPAAWLTAVVVDEDVRGEGVGSALVKRAEQWAMEHGAHTVSLTSALRRKEAHEFYMNRGYEHTGVRLSRKLRQNVASPSDKFAADPSPTTQTT